MGCSCNKHLNMWDGCRNGAKCRGWLAVRCVPEIHTLKTILVRSREAMRTCYWEQEARWVLWIWLNCVPILGEEEFVRYETRHPAETSRRTEEGIVQQKGNRTWRFGKSRSSILQNTRKLVLHVEALTE